MRELIKKSEHTFSSGKRSIYFELHHPPSMKRYRKDHIIIREAVGSSDVGMEVIPFERVGEKGEYIRKETFINSIYLTPDEWSQVIECIRRYTKT